MLVVSFNSLLFLFAEDNPFSIGEHLQQLDREKAAFLHTLHEADNSSHTVVDRRKQVKKASIRIPKKPLSSPKIKHSKTTPHHQTQQQIEIQKRISEVKKIHQERAEALRIKKHKEALLPREQEKELKKKRKSTKRHNKKSTKKQIYPERVDPKVAKSTQNNLPKPKGSTLKNKQVIEQAYIDAIKAVNQ